MSSLWSCLISARAFVSFIRLRFWLCDTVRFVMVLMLAIAWSRNTSGLMLGPSVCCSRVYTSSMNRSISPVMYSNADMRDGLFARVACQQTLLPFAQWCLIEHSAVVFVCPHSVAIFLYNCILFFSSRVWPRIKG